MIEKKKLQLKKNENSKKKNYVHQRINPGKIDTVNHTSKRRHTQAHHARIPDERGERRKDVVEVSVRQLKLRVHLFATGNGVGIACNCNCVPILIVELIILNVCNVVLLDVIVQHVREVIHQILLGNREILHDFSKKY